MVNSQCCGFSFCRLCCKSIYPLTQYIHLNIGGNTEVNVEGLKIRLRSWPHGSSLPSILIAYVQALDNKLDNLCARISFQQDIRNCNVLCFTETRLNPGILDSAIQPGGTYCFPGHRHHTARHGGLGNDAVLLRLPLHAGAGESGEV